MSNDRMHDLDASNRALWAEVKAVRAENDRLRTELAALVELSGTWGGRALRAEAKLARVRELCASPIDERVWSHEVYAEVLRALDGAE